MATQNAPNPSFNEKTSLENLGFIQIDLYEKKEREITTAYWFGLGRVGPVTVGLVPSSEYCVSNAGDTVGT